MSILPDRYRETADPLRTERRLELVLIVVVVILLVQLAYSASRLAALSRPEAIEPAADSLRVVSPLAVVTLGPEQRNEIRNRPLLWKNRRPVQAAAGEEEAAEQGAKAGNIDGIELLGVFGGGDSAGIIAVVKDVQQRVMLGDKVNGWKLESVAANEAVLASGGRSETLVLQVGTLQVSQPAGSRRAGSGRAKTERPASANKDRPSRAGRKRMRSLFKQNNE